MKIKIRECLEMITIMAVSFILSCLKFNGVYFIVSLPLCISLALYKENCFISAYIGVLIASFFINQQYLPLFLIGGFLIVILLFVLYRKSEVELPYISTGISILFSIFMVNLSYIFEKIDVINYLLVPIIYGFVTYNFSRFFIKLKSKQRFSVCWYEYAFLSIIFNSFFLMSNMTIGNFNLSYLLGAILVYAACRVDLVGGVVSYFISMFFYYPESNVVEITMLGVSLIFLIRLFKKYQKTSAVLYLSLILLIAVLTKNNTYLIESIVVALIIFVLPSSIFNELSKYIYDEKNESADFYKEQYFKAMNKNKRIYELIEIIKNKIQENPRMKKKYNDQILNDLSFLIKKNEKEADVNIKEKLKDELSYLRLGVIALKLIEESNGDLFITIEIRDHSDYKNIINIVENITNKKFKLIQGKYNFLTNVTTYEFENKEEYTFEYVVKQRSVDQVCGDSYLCFNANNKKYFLVSDGMGHGRKACEDSKFALFILKSFIELGMDTKKSIEACNALIFSKNDNYNTLDLLEYDCYTNQVVLYKNGSGSSYIQKKDTVSSLTSQNLPLGIVDEIIINEIHIGDNVDRIILTSDGIGKDISEIIKENKKEEIKKVVDKIFEAEEDISDDQTIIAINVIKKEIV